jgi:signal transduction histidine kinase
MFVLSGLAGLVPLGWLVRAEPEAGRRETRRYLLLAGAANTGGGALHVLLSLSGSAYPLGLYLILSAIGLMTYVALAAELPSFSRFAERSQRYTFLAALLSTVWMLALLWATSQGADAGPRWTWESALLLFVLTLTAQPLLTEARSQLTRVVVPGTDAEGLSRALAHSEARAEHAERLAEIGRLSSAVAHEVRNPLGVISACVAVLEHQGADAALLDEVRGAVQRANRFSSDLLDYGRPATVQRHPVALQDVARLGWGEVERALGEVMDTEGRSLDLRGEATVHADGSQLTRLLATLFENALLAGAHTLTVHIEGTGTGATLRVDDDGPGVPAALRDTLFDAFVTGRGRDAPRPGTGLGLAIARGIAERHGGRLGYEASPDGARFVLWLPSMAPEAG